MSEFTGVRCKFRAKHALFSDPKPVDLHGDIKLEPHENYSRVSFQSNLSALALQPAENVRVMLFRVFWGTLRAMTVLLLTYLRLRKLEIINKLTMYMRTMYARRSST
mgnify:CR=1 FL=1